MTVNRFGVRAALVGLAMALAGCATGAQSGDITPLPTETARIFPPGSVYVAMGSSFAAGPGVTTQVESSPQRCGRSNDNYPHQFSRLRQLLLIDVSCGGATTHNLLGPWNELPPQLDAVDSGTRLVTITIGGNDLGYVAGLFRASCAQQPCPDIPAPSEAQYADVAARMDQIVAEIRRRAPEAHIVFVDYPKVLPPQGVCAALPITEAQANIARDIARRLEELTAQAAERNGAYLLPASRISEGRDACAAEPWMNGARNPEPLDGVAYHIRYAGMEAIAKALDDLLPR